MGQTSETQIEPKKELMEEKRAAKKHSRLDKKSREVSIIDEKMRQLTVREMGVGASSSRKDVEDVSTIPGIVIADVTIIDGDPPTLVGSGKLNPPTC